jgi:hypothetical protein
MKVKIVLMLAFVLGACTSLRTYVSPQYSVSDDNAIAIKRFGGGNIAVDAFTNNAEFDNSCGITAGSIKLPDNLSFEGYIQQGLVDELNNAGMYAEESPKITLTGVVEKLSFFSRRNIYTSNWDFGLRVNSSNGQSVYVTEQYNFDAGAGSDADCQQIANAYMPAVQKILGKFIHSPEFKSLITP